jgi:hypothetical protein
MCGNAAGSFLEGKRSALGGPQAVLGFEQAAPRGIRWVDFVA